MNCRYIFSASRWIIVSTVLLFSACTELEEIANEFKKETEANRIPDAITFTQEGLYPEGVSIDPARRRFLVSSTRFGTIGAVSYDSAYVPFIRDTALVSTIGLKVDEARKRVLVAVSDLGSAENSSPETAGKLAALGIYDVVSGKRIHFVKLSDLRPDLPHFANDVTFDKQGNAYVTDSNSPIIYQVGVGGNATVLLENEAFATQPGEFGFNGIAYHPDGFLIAAFAKENALYKIPLDNPDNFTKVQLNAVLTAPDGILLSKDGSELIVSSNAGGAESGNVALFETRDDWANGTVQTTFVTGAVFPTTVTARDRETFVLYAYLNRSFNPENPPVTDFTIKKLPFRSAAF